MASSWYKENGINLNDSVGIDEVGRGSLVGPVVAAVVWLKDTAASSIGKEALVVRDSKKMTQKQRKKVVAWMDEQPEYAVRYAHGTVQVEEIDQLNILRASLLAMERAYAMLNLTVPHVLVDGNKAPAIPGVRTIIKGDSRVLTISLASIIAKEHRDAIMHLLAAEYPDYGWETNVGYGSKRHLEAIRTHGVTPHHRKSFDPVRTLHLL
ncbi:MAG: ribonuclease HII [Holosporaceae bacterium]|jgi:ribonuclease HII|nr:ribonuclease HII [Holosporaceae bacterium]